MLKKRTLALLLSLTMLLTFMPAMAFAEEADDAADQPAVAAVEEAAEEDVVEEAAEEVVQHEALGAEEDEAVPTSLTFTPAAGFEFEATEGDEWLSLDYEGNTFVVGFSDGNKTYKCTTYTEIDEEDGSEDTCFGYFLDGDNTKEQDYFGVEINGVMSYDGGKFKAGDNKVRFSYGYDENMVFTKEYTVKAEMSPIAIEFVPASGVTLWGFESARYVDGNAYHAEGNKFIVTYSDNETKKTFVSVDVPYEEDGKYGVYTGYFEDGVVKKDAKGEYIETYFEDDIPESGLKRGDNDVRFGIYAGEETVWSKPYKVTGKPYAVSASYTPNTVNATIYPKWDDIDFSGQFTLKYNDNSTKTFKPVEVKYPEGGTGHEWKCGDEVLQWGYDGDKRLNEGDNTLTITLYDVKPYTEDDEAELTCNVVVKASKAGVCKTHKLIKIKAVKATCQSQGVKAHYECSVCHKLFTDKKGKKEVKFEKLLTKKAKHVFKKKIVSDEYLKSAATCTKKATYYYACKTCGEKGKKTFTSGKALGHDFVAGSITKATAKKDGKIASKCSRCGKTNKGVKIPKVSKVFSLNKKSIVYVGEGKEKDAISLKIKAGKYPVSSEEYDVAYSEPVYNGKKSKGTVTVTFKPDCKYYSGSITLTYKITKVPKK